MRTIDVIGKRWDVSEIGRHGVAARGEGDALPKPTHGTVLFVSELGERVSRETGAGAINTMTDAQLRELLLQEEPQDQA